MSTSQKIGSSLTQNLKLQKIKASTMASTATTTIAAAAAEQTLIHSSVSLEVSQPSSQGLSLQFNSSKDKVQSLISKITGKQQQQQQRLLNGITERKISTTLPIASASSMKSLDSPTPMVTVIRASKSPGDNRQYFKSTLRRLPQRLGETSFKVESRNTEKTGMSFDSHNENVNVNFNATAPTSQYFLSQSQPDCKEEEDEEYSSRRAALNGISYQNNQTVTQYTAAASSCTASGSRNGGCLQQQQQLLPRNIYTVKDSRFAFARRLLRKNESLSESVQDLRREISEVDEFSVVLQRFSEKNAAAAEMGDVPSNQEQRIMMLKAQVQRQQRHIRQLTAFLQQQRHVFGEVLSICNALIFSNSATSTGTAQHHDDNHQQNSYQHIKKPLPHREGCSEKKVVIFRQTSTVFKQEAAKTSPIRKPLNLQIANQLDKTHTTDHDEETDSLAGLSSRYITPTAAYLQLVKSLENVSDRQRFVENFNHIYQSIGEFEKDNEEFAALFKVSRIGSDKKRHEEAVEAYFRSPLKELFKEHSSSFIVRTAFDGLDFPAAISLKGRLTGVVGVLRTIDKAFKKIHTFDLFQGNPFCFKDLSSSIALPDLLIQNHTAFQAFSNPEKHRLIALDRDRILNTDASLCKLLDRLIDFLASLKKRDENTSNVCELISSISQVCEDLISLGIVTPDDQSSNKNIILLPNRLSMISSDQQQQQQSLSISYDREFEFGGEFSQKMSSINACFEDLCFAVRSKVSAEKCQTICSRLGALLTSISSMFEARETVSKLKTIEIDVYRNLADTESKETSLCREFVANLQTEINSFFKPVHVKFSAAIEAFQGLLDESRSTDLAFKQNNIASFKKNTKEILESLKRIFETDKQSNRVNVLQLQQQFEARVAAAKAKYAHLKQPKHHLSQPAAAVPTINTSKKYPETYPINGN